MNGERKLNVIQTIVILSTFMLAIYAGIGYLIFG
jgi:hypothetical protein